MLKPYVLKIARCDQDRSIAPTRPTMPAGERPLKRRLGVGMLSRRMLPIAAAAIGAAAMAPLPPVAAPPKRRRTLDMDETHTEIEVLTLWLQGLTAATTVQRLFCAITKDLEEGRNIQEAAAALGSIGSSGSRPELRGPMPA